MEEPGRERRVIDIPYEPRKWAQAMHNTTKRNIVAVLHRRAGKSSLDSALVLTPHGWKRMGDIQAGDTVLAPDGKHATVVGVFPQGVLPVYRVTLADGASTVVSGDHLWAVSFANRRRKDKVVTTDYLRAFLERERHRPVRNKSRPLIDCISDKVDFGNEYTGPLDPYAVGLLIGNGSLTQDTAKYSTMDHETVECLVQFAPKRKGEYDDTLNSQATGVAKQLGINCLSYYKRVPEAIMRSNRKARLSVLQGLLDTDGYGGHDGSSNVEFSSTSKGLCQDVVYLARSLGWRAKLSDGRFTQYTHKGEKRTGAESWRVAIRVGTSDPPFRVQRKLDRMAPYRHEKNRAAIVSIEPEGEGSCTCIKIDHPDELYITDDFIVTHNTTAVLNHHQRYALDDAWERRRLKALLPSLTDREMTPLLKNRFYGHVMPTRVQAKMVAWDMLKMYSANVPGVKYNEAELLVRYPNGSRIQLFGAENVDALRGPAFSGLSFDEYSQQPKNIYTEVLSKALADHLGYAIFAGTIKGKDILYKTYEAAKEDPLWFTIWQDIDTSLDTEEGPTIEALRVAMEQERAAVRLGVMTQDEFNQEWRLSATAAIKGAIYINELSAAKEESRITRVPYDPLLPVDTDWDIGVGDATSIWFSQSLRSGEIRLIDYYENSGEGLQHYIKVLKERGYVYGSHYAPHDIKVREFSANGKSRQAIAKELGITFKIAPKLPLEDGINAVRLMLAKCWFDEKKTALGLESLRHYRREWNKKLNEFRETPVHDAHSHAADAIRTLAVRHHIPKLKKEAAGDDPLMRLAQRQQAGLKWMGS